MRILEFADGFESASAPTLVGFEASEVEVTPFGNLASTDVQAALVELQGDVDSLNTEVDAINDARGAASGIATLDGSGKVPTGQLPALAITDVYVVADITERDALTVQEGDIAKVTADADGFTSTYIYDGADWVLLNVDDALLAHTSDTTDAHAASAISNTPSGNLAATNVQSALNELQTEVDGLVPAASPTFTGTVTIPVTASRALQSGASSQLEASAVTSTELGYLSGATSNIQTQINAATVAKTCYLKDVKASGTDGGTMTLGSFLTRTLNTLEGDTSFVSLLSNQFTLAAGTYQIFATAPASAVVNHKIKLYNVTDATDTIIGKSAHTGSTGIQVTEAILMGTFTIAGSKVFEIQHRSSGSRATSGFGLANSFGVDEVYTTVQITKTA